jgi:hypothetical protein
MHEIEKMFFLTLLEIIRKIPNVAVIKGIALGARLG